MELGGTYDGSSYLPGSWKVLDRARVGGCGIARLLLRYHSTGALGGRGVD